jgi:hypothetical protein
MPCKHQVQHPLIHARILQLIHVPRQQSERHRSRHIHPRILQFAVDKNRHRNQPASRRLVHVPGPLIHPHRPNHLFRLRNLVHLSPRRSAAGTPPRQHHPTQHRAKEKISHRPANRISLFPIPFPRLDAPPNPKSQIHPQRLPLSLTRAVRQPWGRPSWLGEPARNRRGGPLPATPGARR